MEFSIVIQGDSEGYIIFECPFCDSEFKLQAGEYQNEEKPVIDLYCPYCGLTTDHEQFISSEIIEQAQAVAYNYMVEKLNKSLKSLSRALNKPKNIIKMKYRPLKKINVKDLKGKDTSEEIFTCQQCEHHVKALFCFGAAKIFCPYCGVDL